MSDPIAECITRLREAADYGEAGMDKHQEEGVVITKLPVEETKFIGWERDGEPRGAAEWVVADGVVDTGARVLFLHGGAYAWYSPSDVYRPLSTKIAKAVGVPVLAIDYRLTPEHLFPAPVTDAVAALGWLWGNGPNGVKSHAEKVFVVGDSAGGGLTFATMLSVLQSPETEHLLPTAAVTYSAYTDLACTLPSYKNRTWRETDREGDPVFSNGEPEKETTGAIETGLEYVGEANPELLKDPLASPYWASLEALSRLPPCFLMVGDAEIMHDDTTALWEKIVDAQGGAEKTTAKLKEYPRMWHDWVMYTEGCHQGRDTLKPAVDALERTGEFIKGFLE